MDNNEGRVRGRGRGNGQIENPNPAPVEAIPNFKPKKKNAYVLFVNARRKQEEARGNQLPKELKDLIPLFSDEWQALDEFERERYKQMAKEYKEQATFGADGDSREESVPSQGPRYLWNPKNEQGRGRGNRSRRNQPTASGCGNRNSQQQGVAADYHDENDDWS